MIICHQIFHYLRFLSNKIFSAITFGTPRICDVVNYDTAVQFCKIFDCSDWYALNQKKNSDSRNAEFCHKSTAGGKKKYLDPKKFSVRLQNTLPVTHWHLGSVYITANFSQKLTKWEKSNNFFAHLELRNWKTSKRETFFIYKCKANHG